jgi:hypothetical protein
VTRTLLLACLLVLPLALGCRRGVSSTPAKVDPKEEMRATERVRRAVPVLNRTLTQNDLNQIRTFMEQARSEKGSYPKSLADLPGLDRDAPKLANAIKSGELVIAGGNNGVLAYEAAALEDRGSVVTTDGVQTMTADELKQKLGQPR